MEILITVLLIILSGNILINRLKNRKCIICKRKDKCSSVKAEK